MAEDQASPVDPSQMTVEEIGRHLGFDPHKITQAQFESVIAAIEARCCRESFYHFVRSAYPVAYGESFIDGPHIGAICYALQALVEGKLLGSEGTPTKILVINAPPSCGKSRLTSCLFPAWMWACNPGAGLWFSSFGQALCDRDALDTRQLISTDWYRRRFWADVHLMDDANQKRRYNTNKGGWRLSASVESRIGFGEHPHALIVDDPHNPEQALSEIERQKPIDTWTNIYSTRGIVKGVIYVVFAQRLHEEDLSGWILKHETNVAHLMLPLEFEPDRRCTLRMTYEDIDDKHPGGLPKIKDEWSDWRTKPGQLLWEAGLGPQKVAELKRRLRRAHAIAGQLQQRPSAPEGDMFQSEWLEFVDEAPKAGRAVRAWDKASTTGARADYTAGALWVDDGVDLYLCDMRRGKWEMTQRDAKILEVAEADAQRYSDYTVVIEQEGGSGGKDAAQIAADQIYQAGFRVRIVKAGNVKKEVRWEPFADGLCNRKIKIVRGTTWTQSFVEELLAAPNGAHDDQIDAAADGYKFLATGRHSGRINRDLLHVTQEEHEMLAEQDAAAGKQLCDDCVGLGCATCGGTGFVAAARGDDLWAVFNRACARGEESDLGVRW